MERAEQTRRGKRIGKGVAESSAINATGAVADTLDAQRLIRDLCEDSKYDEAWSLFKSEPGVVREGQITAFFGSAANDLNLGALLKYIDMLNKDGFTGEPLAAVGALFEVMDTNRLNSLFRESKWIDLFNQLKQEHKGSIRVPNTVGSMLKMRSGTEVDSTDILEVGRNALGVGALDGRNFSDLIAFSSSLSRHDKADMLLDSLHVDSITKDDRVPIITQMIAQDPVQGVNDIVRDNNLIKHGDLVVAISTWSKTDPVAANGWFVENCNSLSGGKLDHIYQGFLESAVSEGSGKVAMMWAEKINDDELREEMLRRVASELPSVSSTEIQSSIGD